MRLFTCFFLIFISFVLSSCGDRKMDVRCLSLQRDSLYSTVRHVRISPPADILELKSYYITSFMDCDSINGVVAYNYRLHSLDLIDIADKGISSIALQKEGPDGIPGRISGICPVSKDSIWLYDGIAMYLVDGMGHVQDKVTLHDRENVIIETNYAMCTARFFYHKEHGSLLYLTARDSFAIEEYDVRNKCIINKYPLSCSLVNPAGEQVYGDMYHPNVNFADEKILYNYPYESSIYVLDMDSGERSVITAESAFTSNMANKCKSNGYAVWERHRIENVHFFDVMYLPGSQLFVRLHQSGVVFDARQSILSVLDGKSLYMSVFDKEFHAMGELKLEDRRYSLFTGWCALANSLLLFNDNSLSDSMDYDRLSVDIVTPAFTPFD